MPKVSPTTSIKTSADMHHRTLSLIAYSGAAAFNRGRGTSDLGGDPEYPSSGSDERAQGSDERAQAANSQKYIEAKAQAAISHSCSTRQPVHETNNNMAKVPRYLISTAINQQLEQPANWQPINSSEQPANWHPACATARGISPTGRRPGGNQNINQHAIHSNSIPLRNTNIGNDIKPQCHIVERL